MTYCNDSDLLVYEPELPIEAAFASQTLLKTTANLAGSTLTITGGSFSDANVLPGQVAILQGDINGCYPIKSIDSATQARISPLHQFADESHTPVGDAIGLTLIVRTFWPQRQIVATLIERGAGVENVSHQLIASPIVKRLNVLGAMHLIYAALHVTTPDSPDFQIRAEHYARAFRSALRNAEIEIDTNGDGAGDIARNLNITRFARV